MSFDVPPLGRLDPTVAPARPAARAKAPATGFAPTLGDAVRADLSSDVPSAPPPELQREVQAAARRFEELARQNRHLHFEPDTDNGRIRVQVRDGEGHVLREIPLTEALDVASGRALA